MLRLMNSSHVDVEGVYGEVVVVAHPDGVGPELLADFEHGEELLAGPGIGRNNLRY